MPDILIVDDDRTMLQALRDGLRHFDYAFDVHIAEDGRKALDMLRQHPMDLVITDLVMPVMSGFELLDELNQVCPDLPVIVMSGLGAKQVELKGKKYEKLQYLEKPLDWVQLVDKIFSGLSNRPSGGFHVVFLPSFLKLIELEKKTCSLVVRSQERSGSLHFINGQLADAVQNGQPPWEAALDIITWKEPWISIDYQNIRRERKIDSELDEILYHALHKEEILKPNSPNSGGRSRKRPEGSRDPIGTKSSPTASPGHEAPQNPTETKDDDTQTFSREGLSGLVKSRKARSTEKEGRALNPKKLNEAVAQLKEDLGDALLATDVWLIGNAVSLAGYQSQPKAVALFDQITDHLNVTLAGSGFPEIDEYFMLKLREDKLVIVVPFREFRWGMLLDAAKVPLGMVLNVAVPNLLQNFIRAQE